MLIIFLTNYFLHRSFNISIKSDDDSLETPSTAFRAFYEWLSGGETTTWAGGASPPGAGCSKLD